MDKETKEYVDSKFSSMEEAGKVAQKVYNTHKMRVRVIVFVCTVILLVLVGVLFSLLYHYQLRGFFQ
ncbi:MAG: hypothetical protein KBD66_01125 [Candidatus Doudnabacteria bacterium]|nr:hypothetical protein [Candidatus Doudnabacteria bacterium]